MSKNLPDHPHVRTIQRYYDACNAYSPEGLRAVLTDDMVHYWVDHIPVSGGDSLASFAAKSASRTKGHWTLDKVLSNGDEAVAEWTMTWTPLGLERQELLRGTEWFIFRDGLIAEVRAYHCNFHLQDPRNFELRDFPYASRGYTVFDKP